MDDKSIVDLYWQRSENAIHETEARYGSYCRIIAYNVLADSEDAEECVNDTWLRAWNSMPSNRPTLLAPYLGKITRHLSISRLRKKNSLKRGSGAESLAFEELRDCLDSGDSVEAEIESKELTRFIRDFLAALEKETRYIFIARYWYMASIEEIADKFGFTQSKVKMTLLRTRNQLTRIWTLSFSKTWGTLCALPSSTQVQ